MKDERVEKLLVRGENVKAENMQVKASKSRKKEENDTQTTAKTWPTWVQRGKETAEQKERECSSWKSRHTEGKTEEQTSWHVGGEQNCCCAKNKIAPICVNELSSEKSPDAQASCHALLTLSIYTAVMFTGQALILIWQGNRTKYRSSAAKKLTYDWARYIHMENESWDNASIFYTY